MVAFLVILAILAGFFGVAAASQATFGVAVIGFACLLAILARMQQAAEYQREQRKWPIEPPKVETRPPL